MSRNTFDNLVRVTGARRAFGEGAEVLAQMSEFTRVHTDTRTLEPGHLYWALRGANFDGDEYALQALRLGAAGVVVRQASLELLDGARELAASLPDRASPVVLEHPDPRRALGAWARAVREPHAGEVIGITGSCGKTSTKEFLATLLEGVGNVYASPASFNNDIGVPLTLLGASESESEFEAQSGSGSPRTPWIVEMGTNAPGEIAQLCRIAAPTGAILTNVGDAHLAGLGSAAGVAQEKGALLESLQPHHFCVLNADSPHTPALRARTQARVWTFALSSPADVMAQKLHFASGGTSFELHIPGRIEPTVVRLPVLGAHMVANFLAAIAAVVAMDLDVNAALQRVPELTSAGHRMQMHRVEGITLIDDCYNANPLSMAAGLRQLMAMPCAGRRVLIAGDMLELGESTRARHREVGALAARLGVQRLCAVGEFAGEVAQGALDHGMAATRIQVVADCAASLDWAQSALRAGDVALIKASRSMGMEHVVDGMLRPATSTQALSLGRDVASTGLNASSSL